MIGVWCDDDDDAYEGVADTGVMTVDPVRSWGVGHRKNMAFSTVYILAVVWKARSSPPRIIFPASQLRGESASGALRRAMMARHAACNPQAGDHSFFRISKQMSPVRKWTFGWNTCVREGVTQDRLVYRLVVSQYYSKTFVLVGWKTENAVLKVGGVTLSVYVPW